MRWRVTDVVHRLGRFVRAGGGVHPEHQQQVLRFRPPAVECEWASSHARDKSRGVPADHHIRVKAASPVVKLVRWQSFESETLPQSEPGMPLAATAGLGAHEGGWTSGDPGPVGAHDRVGTSDCTPEHVLEVVVEPKRLTEAEHARLPLFPTLLCECPDRSVVNVRDVLSMNEMTLVLVFRNYEPDPHEVDSWRIPFMRHFGDHPNAEILHVVVYEGLLRHLYKSMHCASVMRCVPRERHSRYLCYAGGRGGEELDVLATHLKRASTAHHDHRPHLFACLVDRLGRVRWGAQGLASAPELLEMSNTCTQILAAVQT
ncbi:hypothetical protein FVE85_7018 [Porphyridium purpureum]|uniref:Uncharacterized protein n=1 Tax=Porphyridium purpureum TaxID=35688 RepID=A0A5J4Z9K2_PORPP|nr:hypothetical protein FVE85_7018 [Porphyridium purpureum]|eukprot:POR6838..scf295_1